MAGGGTDRHSSLLVAAVMPIAVGVTLVAAIIVRLLEKSADLVPKEFSTFRHLAEWLAEKRGGWCEKCGYELTGNTTGRCPGMRARNHSAVFICSRVECAGFINPLK